MTCDTLYYWRGGAKRGAWHVVESHKGCATLEELRAKRAELERMGYVAVLGRTSIGAPEGPPSAERLAEALKLRLDRLPNAPTEAHAMLDAAIGRRSAR
jgi:hypothetical protein